MNLNRQRVLITGGAGFLGRELVKDLLDECGCRHIKVFSRDEHKHEEMEAWADKIGLPLDDVRFVLGDVRDTALLKYAMRDVDYVIHAAAQKIIPAGQYNPIESVDINYGGWLSVVRAVLDNNRPIKVIGVSTDKACEPLNTYGKAKALGEDLFIHANVYSPEMKFSCVRYGNVIGSTSSLIAKLKGGASSPPLTHEDMTRFFMPVERSVDLIMYAMRTMFGGEIFVPDTKAVRIKDLFRYVSGKDKFKITGIRPGEKLDEVLINRYEAMRAVYSAPWYWVILPEEFAHDGWQWTYPDEDKTRVELRSTDADVLMDFEDIGRFLGVERWTD